MPQWVEILGWTLVHFLWQASLVWLLFGVCSRLASDQSANVRYLLGLASMLAMAAIPVATFFILMAQPAGLPGGAVRQVIGAGPLVEFSAMMPLAVLAWGGGVAWKFWQVVHDLLRVGTITRVGCRPLPPQWQQLVDELSAGFCISRPVRIMESILVQVPAAVGWLRPVVLIPSSALMGLSRQQLELIIAHELAHIRRFDYAVNLGQVLLETLFFFHPAVLSISRRVRAEREVCCDEMVVCSGGNRYQYAQALTLLEDGRGGLPAGSQAALAANGGQLLARIERLACDNYGRSHNLVGSLSVFTGGMAALGVFVLVVLSEDPPTPEQGAPVAGATTLLNDTELRLRQAAAALDSFQPRQAADTVEAVREASTSARRVLPVRPAGPPVMRVALEAPGVVAPVAPAVSVPPRVAWVNPAQDRLDIDAPSLPDRVVRPAMAVVDFDSTAEDSESAALALLSRRPVHRPPVSAGRPGHGIRQLYALSDNDGGDLIFRVDPKYPNSARTRGVEASVTVDFAVNELGAVQDIQIVGDGITRGFRRSVKQAVALWKYSPLWRDGLPVTYRQTQTFNFRLMTPLRVAQGQSCIPHNNDTWACRSLEGTPN